MLTPDKIKEKSFQTSGRGSYRAEDVDNFLDDVVISYEQMFRENGDLIKKISILAKKVEEYRADEESLKLALLNAQKLADKIIGEAKENAQNEVDSVKGATEKLRADAEAETKKLREETEAAAAEMTANAKRESAAIVESAKAEAEKIINEANRQSNEILGNINRKVTHESLVYDMIQKEASDFKGKLVAMYKEHISLINQLPEIVEAKLDEEEAKAAAEEAASEEPAEVYTEDAPVAEPEEIQEELATEEPETEEISSSADSEPDVVVAEEAPEAEKADEAEETPAEPVKLSPFKLDFSKIDFAEDEEETVEAPVAEPIVELTEDAPADADDGAASISFKNFFRKK